MVDAELVSDELTLVLAELVPEVVAVVDTVVNSQLRKRWSPTWVRILLTSARSSVAQSTYKTPKPAESHVKEPGAGSVFRPFCRNSKSIWLRSWTVLAQFVRVRYGTAGAQGNPWHKNCSAGDGFSPKWELASHSPSAVLSTAVRSLHGADSDT